MSAVMPLCSAAIRLIRVRGRPQARARAPADSPSDQKFFPQNLAGMHRLELLAHLRAL